jgi:manganese oxidase
MSSSRRDFLRGAALTTLGIVSAGKLSAQHQHETPAPLPDKETQPSVARTSSNGRFLPVETPDVPMLSYSIENGVKVFHLVAEVVKQDFLPGRSFYCWGYNGSVPGPGIEVME